MHGEHDRLQREEAQSARQTTKRGVTVSTTDYKDWKYSEQDELQTTKRGSTVSTTDYKERKHSEHDELQTTRTGSTVSTMNYRLQRATLAQLVQRPVEKPGARLT